ncbi:hypothetical protein EVAR_6029_1 [Eumeta japonica]|uniref:Uncharacterized protein n=1 Tax=Eumeta variegata TaxID=151549 RepID=A0A4C1TCN3_EUMVA|nr:hypothetical protein EVAR_6029_1 [Eumeta japonica]
MVRPLAMYNDNVSEAVCVYRERFGIRVNWNTILSVTQRRCDIGLFRTLTTVDRDVNITNIELQENVFSLFEENPEESAYQAVTVTGGSQTQYIKK